MPIYEYQCPECGHVFEEWVNIKSATTEAPCPKCGGQAMHIISNTAFVLKGGGWYVTDYGSRKSDGHNDSHDSAAVSPAAVTPAATPAASSTPSTDAAPAKSAEPAPAKEPAATPAASSAASA